MLQCTRPGTRSRADSSDKRTSQSVLREGSDGGRAQSRSSADGGRMTLSPFSKCGCGHPQAHPAHARPPESTSRSLNDERSRGGWDQLTSHAHLVHTCHRVAAVAALETTAAMRAVVEHTAELRPSAPRDASVAQGEAVAHSRGVCGTNSRRRPVRGVLHSASWAARSVRSSANVETLLVERLSTSMGLER